jgi:hypothetical protein
MEMYPTTAVPRASGMKLYQKNAYFKMASAVRILLESHIAEMMSLHKIVSSWCNSKYQKVSGDSHSVSILTRRAVKCPCEHRP